MFNVIKSEFSLVYKKLPLVFLIAWDEIKVRYVRSVLGPFWLVLTTAISALGLGYVWSILFNQDRETFIPALCIGLVIWQFLSSCILDASNCFITYSGIIKNNVTPILVFPAVIVTRNFFIFMHNAIIIVFVLLIYPPNISLNMLMLIPGLLLVMLNLILVVAIIAFLSARYRDLIPAIASLMTILFFLSPVIYKPDQLGVKAYLMQFNPFTHLISLIRDPLTGNLSQPITYLLMSLSLLISAGVVSFLVSRCRYRLVFWL